MSVFAIPNRKDFTGVTLGPQVVSWMETFLVFGPGDIRGRQYQLDIEKRAIMARIYELWPPGRKTPEKQDIGGRRRFKRAGISVRKGWAKTELAAAIAAAELHPRAPVRFDHWAEEGEISEWGYIYKKGEPVGVGVKDPYIPMVAYTEEQSEELAYGALCVMLGEGPLADDFDIGLDRILVLSSSGRDAGKAVALAAAPESRDGARTSFQVFDETHRMVLEKLLAAHQTMLANIPKRKAADAWTLEITTSFEPGLGSVAEGTMEYAEKISEGKAKESRLFFYHRQAHDKHEIRDIQGNPNADAMRAAVIEASGPAAIWTDIDAIVDLGLDPQTDPQLWERLWLNRPVQQSGQAFPMGDIEKLEIPPDEEIYDVPGKYPPDKAIRYKRWTPDRGAKIVVGFDGSQTRDTTALVGTDLASGRQWLIAIWKNPGTDDKWKVPPDEVDQTVAQIFEYWNVWRMYADPYYWDTHVADWQARYIYRGDERVFPWATNVHKKMAISLKAYIAAMREGVWHYDGNPDFKAHLANSQKYAIPILDEDGENLFLIRKVRPDSPHKIDAAMAGCLSWEAYRDAIAAGVTIDTRSRQVVNIY